MTAALLGACGDESSQKELSNETAASLRATLSELEQDVESQDCTGAVQEVASLRAQAEGLPQRVDADLRDALSASAGRLETLVADRCQSDQTTTPQAPAGTTSEDGAQPPQGDENQTDKPKKDKAPKKEKPPKDEQPAPDTGGAGQEDPNLDQQGGGAVPPGQE